VRRISEPTGVDAEDPPRFRRRREEVEQQRDGDHTLRNCQESDVTLAIDRGADWRKRRGLRGAQAAIERLPGREAEIESHDGEQRLRSLPDAVGK
jgi:hypothetical protein